MKRFSRISLVQAAVGLVCLITVVPSFDSALGAPKRPVNLLFLLTDQQQFGALCCAGNRVIKTPKLDRLAGEGARFENAYTCCPVCVPARTVIATSEPVHTAASNTSQASAAPGPATAQCRKAPGTAVKVEVSPSVLQLFEGGELIGVPIAL